MGRATVKSLLDNGSLWACRGPRNGLATALNDYAMNLGWRTFDDSG